MSGPFNGHIKTAVETTWAMVLARFFVPLAITIGFSMMGWIGNSIYNELISIRLQMINILIEQGKLSVIVSTNDRRIDVIENIQRQERNSR